jgi:hypothetical protein
MAEHTRAQNMAMANTDNTPPARSRAIPQHLINTERNREHKSSPQSKHHTADFTARGVEHGHTEQSLAHATVHEQKHPV